MQKDKRYDLEERTLTFAKAVRAVVKPATMMIVTPAFKLTLELR